MLLNWDTYGSLFSPEDNILSQCRNSPFIHDKYLIAMASDDTAVDQTIFKIGERYFAYNHSWKTLYGHYEVKKKVKESYQYIPIIGGLK